MFTTFDTCEVCNRPGWCYDHAAANGFLWCSSCAHSGWRMHFARVNHGINQPPSLHVNLIDRAHYTRAYYSISLN